MAFAGPQKLRSEFITGARKVYAEGTNRLNVPALQTYVNGLLGRDVPLTLTPASTKQEVVANLRDIFQRERVPGCCFGTNPAFTPTQVENLPGLAYDTHLTSLAGSFNAAQDHAFMESIGLHIDDARLTALTGDETTVLKGLMDVLHAEESTGNISVRRFMEGPPGGDGRYPLNADDPMLRAQILAIVPSLKNATPSGLSLEGEIIALRSETGVNAEQAHNLAACLARLSSPDRVPPVPLLFRTEENIQTIKKMAASVLADTPSFQYTCRGNVSDPAIIEGLTPHNTARFIGIVNQLVQGCQIAEARITRDFPGTTAIKMTGSDMHHGQSVHILTTTDGSKHVYKPRNIGVDMAVCGGGGMFATLNGLSADIQLPIMGFMPNRDATGEYGYTQFIDNSAQSIVMNEVEANNFYKQLGQLVVACMTLGIADIHQDNIMAGIAVGADKKPYIIDAEVAFLPHKIMTEDAPSLEFTKERHLASSITNNAIISGEDIKHLLSGIGLQSGSSHFQAYIHSFQQGAQTMQAVLQFPTAPPEVFTRLEALKVDLQHIRLVPLKTEEFESARTALTPETVGLVTDELCKSLAEKFASAGIMIDEGAWPHISSNLVSDLATGNIPLMHYNAQDNVIMYNQERIGGYVAERGNITPLVEMKLAAIAAMPPENLVRIL